jgi:alpha-beta hydrolase superfamily lysophospholipase
VEKPRRSVLESPERGSISPRLRTEDGVELATRSWPLPVGARAAVVLVHGLAANKDDLRVVALAEELSALGFEVLAYDSRGHGQSGGLCTLGHLERFDVAAAADSVRSRGVPIVVVGASMGAVATLAYAATAPDIAGVVAVSSPAEWRLPFRPRSVLTATLARTKAGRHFAHRKMNVRIAPWSSPEPPRALLDRVECPLVIVHGGRDPIIPISHGLESALQADERRSIAVVPHMGHAFDPAGYPQICDAVAWVLSRG